MVWFSKYPWYWPLPTARIYKIRKIELCSLKMKMSRKRSEIETKKTEIQWRRKKQFYNEKIIFFGIVAVSTVNKADFETNYWKSDEKSNKFLPSCMFALWCSAQHRNIWYDNNIVLGSIRKFFTEDECLFLVETDCTIFIVNNVYFFPRLTIMEKKKEHTRNWLVIAFNFT